MMSPPRDSVVSHIEWQKKEMLKSCCAVGSDTVHPGSVVQLHAKGGTPTHICIGRVFTFESKMCSTTGSKGIGHMGCLSLSCISVYHCEIPVRCGHIAYLS